MTYTGTLYTKDFRTFTIVDCEENDIVITDIQKIRPCMPYDTVSYNEETGVLTLVEPTDLHQRLTGTLELTSKTRYGQSSRGVPLYLFRPDHVAYPPFIVGSSTKDNTKNVRVLVSYDSWTDTLPRGILLKTYGPAGTYEAEESSARDYASLGPLPTKYKTVCAAEPLLPEESIIECIPESAFICNIDPPGCLDIDDVIGYTGTGTGTSTTWWIVISAAAAYVAPGSPIDNAAYMRGATLYTPDGTILTPMLPSQISTDVGSLHADGRSRPGIAWKFTLEDANIIDAGLSLVWVRNKSSYSYETVLEKMPSIHVEQFKHMVRALKGDPDDPHSWVECAMVAYNIRYAQWLHTNAPTTGILRAHRGPDVERYAAYARLGGPALSRYAVESARYVPATEENMTHVGLGEDIYTHASSPLRRYVDLHNQRLFLQHTYPHTYSAGPGSVLQKERRTSISYMNLRTKALKSYAHALHFLDCLSGATRMIDGLIIEVNPEKKKIRLYVEQWKMLLWWRNAPTDLMKESTIGCVVRVRYYVNKNAAGWKNRFVLEEVPATGE